MGSYIIDMQKKNASDEPAFFSDQAVEFADPGKTSY